LQDAPSFLTSWQNPQLGVKGPAKRLHRYALRRIFRPALEIRNAD
jgi:hypothetical protein